MIRPKLMRPKLMRLKTALLLGAIAAGAAALCGCAGDNAPPAGEPTFYADLAKPDAVVDAEAAQSMISGYRGNNGLGALTVDPELMRLASEQAHAMAAHDKMDHDTAPNLRQQESAPFTRERFS